METFCEEPDERNSKRRPAYGRGEDRFRGSAEISMPCKSTAGIPRSTFSFFTEKDSDDASVELANAVRYCVRLSPRWAETQVGGASLPPVLVKRKSLPGQDTDAIKRLP
mmetsp:Transcript_112430/g.176949  ORF Transcript_112430/g.176949 Transcript_112430/m.176949 type:complete len:109 (-) Transcript_112430:45-371(-)